MTLQERATIYAYCLVNQAKDFLDTAYRVLTLDDPDGHFLKDRPDLRKFFCNADMPINNLVEALSREAWRFTDSKEDSKKRELNTSVASKPSHTSPDSEAPSSLIRKEP